MAGAGNFSTPSPTESMTLGLAADANVARISRLRLAGGRPMAIENASLSADILPDPKNISDSLYAHLEKAWAKAKPGHPTHFSNHIERSRCRAA